MRTTSEKGTSYKGVTPETREWFKNLKPQEFAGPGDSERLTPERAKRLAANLVPRKRGAV